MGNSKVIFGNETLIDLTGDTVTPDTLLAGTTAHNRSGEQIVGTATVPEELDDLTDVTLTSPAEGDLLQRDGNGKWVNSAKIPQKVAGLQKTGCVNRLPNNAISQVKGGITFTVNSDKSVTILPGTATELTTLFVYEKTSNYEASFTVNAPIKIVGCPSGGSSNTFYLYAKVKNANGTDFATYYDYGNGEIFSIDGNAGRYIINAAIQIKAGTVISSPITFKPMITDDLSATYADYQPYAMTNRELTEAAARAITVDKNWAFTGEYSTLTDNTTFTCPEDGYLYIQMPKQSTGEVRVVYDGNNALFSETVLPSPDIFFKRVVFLRKGLKIKYVADGATPPYARFYPIV